MARLIVLLCLLVPACTLTRLPPAERMRRSKCGACHIAPGAGSMTIKSFAAAMADHKRRVPLTPEEINTLKAHLVNAPKARAK